MSDFHFQVSVTRDKLADCLTENIEQTPYVLSQVARHFSQSRADFKELCIFMDYLAQEDAEALRTFCLVVQLHLEGVSDGQ